MNQPNTRGSAQRMCTALAAFGLVVAVAGSFLPWFDSGAVARNSYQASGLIDRFEIFDNPLVIAGLRGWIGLPLLAACCVALYALRLPRSGAVLTVVFTVPAGVVALLVISNQNGGSGPVVIATTGPVITTAGAVLAAAAAIGVLITTRRDRREVTETGGVRA